jgi:hypothetical protein
MNDVEFCIFIDNTSILTSELIKDYCNRSGLPYNEIVHIKESMCHDIVAKKLGGHV